MEIRTHEQEEEQEDDDDDEELPLTEAQADFCGWIMNKFGYNDLGMVIDYVMNLDASIVLRELVLDHPPPPVLEVRQRVEGFYDMTIANALVACDFSIEHTVAALQRRPRDYQPECIAADLRRAVGLETELR